MTKLKIFIVAQIVLGCLLGFIALQFLPVPFNSICGLLCYGLVVSHVSLLGFWLGMGLSALWKRLLGFFAGVSGLWIVVGLVLMRFYIFKILFFLFVNAGVVAVITFSVRWFGVRLHKMSEEEQVSPAPKMQFTIRGLFMVTFCAALLLLVARVIRDDRFTFRYEFLLYLEFSLVIIFATLLCMWAALSLASPCLPTVITIVVVLLMSLLVIWSIRIEYAGLTVDIGVFFLSHFLWTLATLLVLRSYGYRLTSKKLTPPTKTV